MVPRERAIYPAEGRSFFPCGKSKCLTYNNAMAKKRIGLLALDDDPTILGLFEDTFSPPEYSFKAVRESEAALRILDEKEFDVVLLDLHMPDRDGIDVLREIRSREVPVEVVVLTGHGTVTSAVEAMKLGACDFLAKPINLEELKVTVQKAWRQKNLARENLLLRTEEKRRRSDSPIIFRSAAMEKVIDTAAKVAASDFPVLITGETGVGKELVASEIHRLSHRSEKSFVPINCGALPESMLESELFGYERGAFTGAASRKPGLFEVADEGTLFLDEVGELPPALQGKLLRALENGRFFRLGGTREIQVDIRFISATNRDLHKNIAAGTFRQDLFFRISALPVHIPALRERREDIPLLVNHFSQADSAGRARDLSDETLKKLAGYEWPGNVRELQNAVHRLHLLGEEDPGVPPATAEAAAGKEVGPKLADVERDHILRVFRNSGRRRKKTADLLGIDPKTLYRKLKGYGIENPSE